MQNRNTSKLSILILVLFTIASNQMLFAQGGDSIRGKGLFVGLSLEPSQTLITNNGNAAVAGIVSENKITYGGSVEIGYFFSKYIGLSSGIGYSSYGSKLSLAAYQNYVTGSKSGFRTIDSENEAYDLLVSGKSIEEEQTVNYFHVPVYLNLRLPITKGIGVFVQAGANMSFAMNQNYKSSGTFTYKGYYSKYNIILENLPNYGFPTNKATTAEGIPEIQSFTVFAVGTAGFDCFLNDRLQFAVAASYRKALSDISAYAADGQYQLSPAVNKINSLMAGSSSLATESIGISVKLRCFF